MQMQVQVQVQSRARTIRSAPRPGGGRDLLQLDLWEVSIVTFPMLAQARLRVVEPSKARLSASAA